MDCGFVQLTITSYPHISIHIVIDVIGHGEGLMTKTSRGYRNVYS